MAWTELQSSLIAAIDHDDARGVLKVKFRNGSVHSYRGVPADKVEEIMSATSAGQYFLLNIKGQYPSERG